LDLFSSNLYLFILRFSFFLFASFHIKSRENHKGVDIRVFLCLYYILCILFKRNPYSLFSHLLKHSELPYSYFFSKVLLYCITTIFQTLYGIYILILRYKCMCVSFAPHCGYNISTPEDITFKAVIKHIIIDKL